MAVFVVMMGRGGSSMEGKNKALVAGVPLMSWGMRVAKSLLVVDAFYFSSDDPEMLSIAEREGYRPIHRPTELATDSALGCDVLKHALNQVREFHSFNLEDIVVMQHANSATYTPSELQECVDLMLADPSLDCVAPAHIVSDYHPYRVKRLRPDLTTESFFSPDFAISSNRQDLPQAVAFNHSFWVVRAGAIFLNAGEPPWTCMGSNVRVVLTEPRNDVHSHEDISRTTDWVQENLIPLGLGAGPVGAVRASGDALL